VGHGAAAEEMDAGLPQPHGITRLASPAAARERVALQAALQPQHRVERLGLVGGRDRDDLDLLFAKEQQQVGFDVRLGFVLARLAREEHHEGQPELREHAVYDGLGHLRLVGAQRDAHHESGEFFDGAGQALGVQDVGRGHGQGP